MKKILLTMSTVGILFVMLLASMSVLAQEELDLGIAGDNLATALTHQLLALSVLDAPQRSADTDMLNNAPNCAVNECVFLPFSNRAPEITDQAVFHTTSCPEPFKLTRFDSNNVLDLGNDQKEIQFAVAARGYEGSRYETYYVINGGERRDFGTSGTIASNVEVITSAPLIFGTGSSCQKTLPAGTYGVRFLIDGNLVQELTVILR